MRFSVFVHSIITFGMITALCVASAYATTIGDTLAVAVFAISGLGASSILVVYCIAARGYKGDKVGLFSAFLFFADVFCIWGLMNFVSAYGPTFSSLTSANASTEISTQVETKLNQDVANFPDAVQMQNIVNDLKSQEEERVRLYCANEYIEFLKGELTQAAREGRPGLYLPHRTDCIPESMSFFEKLSKEKGYQFTYEVVTLTKRDNQTGYNFTVMWSK